MGRSLLPDDRQGSRIARGDGRDGGDVAARFENGPQGGRRIRRLDHQADALALGVHIERKGGRTLRAGDDATSDQRVSRAGKIWNDDRPVKLRIEPSLECSDVACRKLYRLSSIADIGAVR